MSSAVANRVDGQIWGGGQGRSCRGKITKLHVVVLGAIVGGAALVLGLSVGLSNEASELSSRAVGQATDPASLGCFYDRRHSRIMTDVLSDEWMTPPVGQGWSELEGRLGCLLFISKATEIHLLIFYHTHIASE